jgi:hypothetical protein
MIILLIAERPVHKAWNNIIKKMNLNPPESLRNILKVYRLTFPF